MTTPLQGEFQIDPLRLDSEWAKHPQRVANAGVKLAELQKIHDDIKNSMAKLAAELGRSIRDTPTDYGIGKVTEQTVYDAVIMQPEYVALQRNLSTAKYNLQIAEAEVNALEHTKRALTMLVELFVKDYYSEGSSQEYDKAAIRRRGQTKSEDAEN